VNRRDPPPDFRARVAVLWRRWGGHLIGALAFVVLAAVVWYLLSGTASTKREVAATPTLVLPPPPPPPPEPEKLPEPEPEKVKPEIKEPEPKPMEPLDPPKDDSPPSPSKDLGDPVTIIGAGSGGGMTGGGGGLGSRSYASWLSSALQQAFARDARTRQLAFDDIRIDVWLDADGTVTRVQLSQGTGNAKTDEAVLAMVREFRADERPPATLRSPLRMSIKGRRP
jgi:TonB family protein